MCHCKTGCCANQICGLLFGAINLGICTAYIIALTMLAMECGHACYPHYFNPHLYAIIMILSAVILYVFGFLLSCLAYKRGEGDITGCNIWIIILIDVILLGTLLLCVWNLYDLIQNAIVNTSNYPKLYVIMVIVNIIWNVLLLIITVNVLRNTQSTNKKSKGSFTELSPLDDRDDDDNDLQQMTSKSSVFMDEESKKSISAQDPESDDDDEWRKDNSTPHGNVYDNSSKWQQSEGSVKTKTEKHNSKTEKQSNQESAYKSGFDASVEPGKPLGNSSEVNMTKDTKDVSVGGRKATSGFDFDNRNSAWS